MNYVCINPGGINNRTSLVFTLSCTNAPKNLAVICYEFFHAFNGAVKEKLNAVLRSTICKVMTELEGINDGACRSKESPHGFLGYVRLKLN